MTDNVREEGGREGGRTRNTPYHSRVEEGAGEEEEEAREEEEEGEREIRLEEGQAGTRTKALVTVK